MARFYGPRYGVPTDIFAGNIWMPWRNSVIFGTCKLHKTTSDVVQILFSVLSY